MQSAYQKTQISNLQKQLNSLASLYQQQVNASLLGNPIMFSGPSGYPLKASSLGFSAVTSMATIAGPINSPTHIFPSAFGVPRGTEDEMTPNEKNAAALRRFLKEAGL